MHAESTKFECQTAPCSLEAGATMDCERILRSLNSAVVYNARDLSLQNVVNPITAVPSSFEAYFKNSGMFSVAQFGNVWVRLKSELTSGELSSALMNSFSCQRGLPLDIAL